MKRYPLYRGSAGWNNITQPEDLHYDPDTGVQQLQEGVNLKHTIPSSASMRDGFSSIVTGNKYHSGFCDKGPAFMVKDVTSSSSIMLLAEDDTLQGVRSGLTFQKRVSFCDVIQSRSDGALYLATYYGNGHENGVITDGISTPWPSSDHVGPTTKRKFSNAPVAEKLTWYAGRMVCVIGDTGYISEPYAPSEYVLNRNFFRLPGRIRMAKGVENGLYMSDDKNTYFFEGTELRKDIREHIVAPYPALEWSEADRLVKGTDIGLETAGLCALWVSTEGACIGLPDGTVKNMSRNTLIYPSGITEGASLLRGLDLIHTMA